MQIKPAVTGKELEALIAEDIKRPAPVLETPSIVSERKNGGLASIGFNTARFQEWFRAAQDSAAAVGRMPPSSLTLRSRVGAILVRIVRRMLFWYTPQITGFNTTVLSVIQEQFNLIQQVAALVPQMATEINALKTQVERLDTALVEAAERLDTALFEAKTSLNTDIKDVSRGTQELLGYIRSGDLAREKTEKLALDRASANEAQISQLRTMLFAQEHRPAAVPSTSGTTLPEPHSDRDNLYLMLEDSLRGPRDEITIRLTRYLPYLEEAGIGAPGMPVLDLGCGRGEWLELLRHHQLAASGVDLNATFVSYCQQLGLDIAFGDAIASLRERASESLGAITGFHIVEHLAWPKLVELVDETIRVLKPGGLAIFETPNPTNVLVGSLNFYLDPTHRHPLPSRLLQFLLEARGLRRVEVLPLHPCPETVRVPDDGSAIVSRFNEYFYGPQDYAVIGRKA